MKFTLDTPVKILRADGSSCNGGSGKWHLPQRGKPGKWMSKVADIRLCKRGYHTCTVAQSLEWANAAAWTVEVRGASLADATKSVHEGARLLARIETWNDRNLRLFAADCAARALNLVKSPDPRSIAAVTAARRFALGEIDATTLAAAGDAAGDAERKWQVGRWLSYLNGKALAPIEVKPAPKKVVAP